MSQNIVELIEQFYQNRLEIYQRHGIENYDGLVQKMVKKDDDVPLDFSEHAYTINDLSIEITQHLMHVGQNEITILSNVLKERDEKDDIQDYYIQKSREFILTTAVQRQFSKAPFAIQWLINNRFERSAELLTKPNPDNRYQMGIVQQSAALLSFVIGGVNNHQGQFYENARKVLLPETVQAIKDFILYTRENYDANIAASNHLPNYMPLAYQEMMLPEIEKLGQAMKKDTIVKHLADDFLYAGLELSQNVDKHRAKLISHALYFPN